MVRFERIETCFTGSSNGTSMESSDRMDVITLNIYYDALKILHSKGLIYIFFNCMFTYYTMPNWRRIIMGLFSTYPPGLKKNCWYGQ